MKCTYGIKTLEKCTRMREKCGFPIHVPEPGRMISRPQCESGNIVDGFAPCQSMDTSIFRTVAGRDFEE